MARVEARLNIGAGRNGYQCVMQDDYKEVVTTKQKVDNSDAFITIATLGASLGGISSAAGVRMKGAKFAVIKNNSPVAVELQLAINQFEDSSDIDQFTASGQRYVSQILGANEYVILPNQWIVAYDADNSAGNAKTIDNKGGADVNSNRMYVDSGINLGANVEDSDTQVTVGDTDVFRVGDLIQLGVTTGTTATKVEIMRVTAITSSTVMQVERGLYGSITADKDAQTDSSNGATSGSNVHIPFFNTENDYDKDHLTANLTGYIKTNHNGRYSAQNLFGYGRSTTYPTGIVKGSLALKFYNNGYQELGLSGITGSTNSGLAASTAYAFNITVDGGSEFANLSFTTDATNLNFGGNNGILSKIQSALDDQYYTAGNLFEKRVIVSIVNGDIRFTSHNRTRVSAIALAAPGSGTTPFGVGRIPAIGSIRSAVAAKLPDDTIFDRQSNEETKNIQVFAYDDGKGNIRGACTGTINYETGAIKLHGPADAEFVASFNYDSAHSGGINETANQQNILKSIGARSMNSKIDAEVEVIAYI